MINGVIIIHVVQLTIVQETQLGAVTAEVTMSIIHIAETRCVAIVWLWAHVSVVPLTMTEDTVAPLGALLVDVISAVLLALTAVEPPLALAPPPVMHMFIALLLCYMSNGGIVDEGSTNSTTITPCHSSNVAIAGMVMVMSLITSPYGVINMATIVCSG
jgi:hypothetical protein